MTHSHNLVIKNDTVQLTFTVDPSMVTEYGPEIVTTFPTNIASNLMLNHHHLSASTHGGKTLTNYTIDDDNVISFTFKREHHGKKIIGAEITFEATIVPRIESIQQTISYPEPIKRRPITTHIKYVYEHQYQKSLMDMAPAYQRDFVWTQQQKESYILNLYRNCAELKPTIAIYIKDDNHDQWIYEIIDGKQRLSAIFDFIENKFAVQGHYFKDLCQKDQHFLYDMRFEYTDISTKDFARPKDETLIQLFLEINMLGTRMSDEDLQKAQDLLK